MTEKDLGKFALLEEFTIMELEQRLEFEGWYDGNCICNFLCPGDPNGLCDPPPLNEACPPIDDPCIPEI